jgi:ribose 5-phosphate isomerase A
VPSDQLPRAGLAEQKAHAARKAVDEVRDGMIVGLGTGSTAAFVIEEIGKRVGAGLKITGVATSLATDALARTAGIAMRGFDDVAAIDLAIDGIDAIDPQMRAVKGRGGAMLREKIIASAAARMIAVADASKSVARLTNTLLPVEVLPFARAFVGLRLMGIGAPGLLRVTSDGTPWLTDQGNLVLDCDISGCSDLAGLGVALDATPGVLGHGLFLDEVDALYVGLSDGSVTRSERNSAEQ